MVSLKIQGGQQLATALSQFALSKQRGLLTQMLIRAGEPMRQRAAELAPVEAGKPDLKDHIAIASTTRVSSPETIGSRAREEGEAAVAIGPEPAFFYGLFMEFGALHAKSGEPIRFQPFLRPALDERSGEALRLLQEEIWEFLRTQASRSTGGRGL